MTDKTSTLRKYHELYVFMSDLKIPWDFGRMSAWERFAAVFTLDDLRDLIRYIRQRQFTGKPARSLGFRSLISGPESIAFAQEDLAQARLRKKPWTDPARAQVLQATGRPAQREAQPRSAEQIIKDDQAFAEFRKWKEQNL